MGTVLAFAVGYVFGVRGGRKGFDDVVESIKTIKDSEEAAAIVRSLRSHAAYLLREVTDIAGSNDLTSEEILTRLQRVARSVDPRSTAS